MMTPAANVVSAVGLAVTMVALVLGLSGPAAAGAIAPDGTFREFSFDLAGVPATGCDPADPAGGFCIPSFGTPTVFLDAPPWTFTIPSGGGSLLVVDAFEIGDRFDVFDFGVSLGLTSLPGGAGGDCGDDPVVCLADPAVSRGTFPLGAGPHSLTIVPESSPAGGGAAYLQVTAAAVAVPLPGTAILVLSGFIGAWQISAARRRFAQRNP